MSTLTEVRCWYCKRWECLDTCPAYQKRLAHDPEYRTQSRSPHRLKDTKRDWTGDHKTFLSRWSADVRAEFRRAVSRVKIFEYVEFGD